MQIIDKAEVLVEALPYIQKFRNSITIGSRVVTSGGIYGDVRGIEEADNILVIEIAKGVNIRVDRNSVYATAQQDQVK